MSADSQGNGHELPERMENVGLHRVQGILGDGRPFPPAMLTPTFGT